MARSQNGLAPVRKPWRNRALGPFWGCPVVVFAVTALTLGHAIAIAQASLSRAQALNREGSHQLAIGQVEAALVTWKQAEAAYSAAGDDLGKLGSQLNQIQALRALGQYRQAKKLLEPMDARLQPLPDSPLKAKTLQSLGIAHFQVGDLEKSYSTLQSSLQIARRLKEDLGNTLVALGNVVRVQVDSTPAISGAATATASKTVNAIAFYQQAITQTSNPSIQLEAYLNLFSLLLETQQTTQALTLLSPIQTLLTKLPPSRSTIYAQVNLATSLMKIPLTSPTSPTSPTAIAHLLADAIQTARNLNDARAEAYALGQLGHLYERSQQWADTETVTRQALQIAQSIQATDIAVSWQWQLGRILRQQGRTVEAIAAYSQAVDTLSTLRGDLVAINPAAQFSFRERVEPIYRELVQLLLAGNPTQADLQRARVAIEALQLAELNNFFREACLDAKPQQIDQVDPNAAVIYSIILPDRLAVILALPDQPLQHYATQFAAKSQSRAAGMSSNHAANPVDQAFDDLVATLNPFVTSPAPLGPHQQLYDWLMRPAETALAQSQIQTVVFVMDGVLRGVPLAALHDGQQYLIEKYNLALTPGLQLLPPRSLPSRQFRTLAGGLSAARQGFSALPGVAQELQEVAAIVPTSLLINQTFNQSQLIQKLASDSFPIVHLATHGQFSSNADETFLLTWDGKLKLQDLDQLLELNTTLGKSGFARQPIELLILSACQTAVGDKRAALGLAGVAIRSGARSTIATLWSVQDGSTAQLIAQFYAALKQPGTSRAAALRQAQLAVLRSPEYQHPYYWAPFVLVGNWQ